MGVGVEWGGGSQRPCRISIIYRRDVPSRAARGHVGVLEGWGGKDAAAQSGTVRHGAGGYDP